MNAYCVFRRPGEAPRVGARAGDSVVDLAVHGIDEAFGEQSLNAFMARGPEAWAEAAERIAALLDGDGPGAPALVPVAEVELLLPFEVADYADFFASLDHASNAGRIFRPDADDPLTPNWRHLPVGYHGRAGTVVVSGTPVVRPCGQLWAGGDLIYGPTRALDLELELGFVIGVPTALGEPVPIERALDHVFGVVLLNDWSARDIQIWESLPLGPFLGKSFATTISPWVVPVSELARVPALAQEPEPLPYLRSEPWAYDIALELELNGAVVARTNARNLYWHVAQMVAHLTVNGASLRTGDLLGSGTISGPEPSSRACMLELSWNGAEPVQLPDGSTRTYLEDGDEVVLRGEGLGEARGRIVPAV